MARVSSEQADVPPADTASVLTYRMGVQDANIAGNVHGGWIMKLCDDVAAIAATRLAGGPGATGPGGGMRLPAPIPAGEGRSVEHPPGLPSRQYYVYPLLLL